MHLSLPSTAFLLFACVPLVVSRAPIAIPWSQDTYGPDGPWQAVKLSIGGSDVSLYPGTGKASYAFSTGFCKNGPSNCTARQAGLYDEQASSSKDISQQLTGGGIGQFGSDAIMNYTSNGTLLLDDFAFASDDADHQKIEAKNMLMWSVDSQTTTPPSGSSYPQRVAGLALGWANSTVERLSNGKPNGSTPTFIGSLQQTYNLPSKSWGLHVGSARYHIPGSLIVGGYDSTRAIGDVFTGSLTPDGEPVVTLTGIRINSNSTADDSKATRNFLLDGGNASLPVTLHPSVPYLSLPAAVCAAAATFLPLTFLPRLGLYAWDTADPRYASFIDSPRELNFHFAGSRLIVRVPLKLLNLTLEPPLVDAPTPYFPCSSSENRFALGRAFLQAAYLAVNWDRQLLFLAQAPGPGYERAAKVAPFAPDATAMAAGSAESFDASWSNAQAAAAASSAAAVASPSSAAPGGPASAGGGLSTGAVAGIAVGATAAGFALLGLLAFLVLRARRQRRAAGLADEKKAPVEMWQPEGSWKNGGAWKTGKQEVLEMEEVRTPVVEADAGSGVVEADGGPKSELPAWDQTSR